MENGEFVMKNTGGAYGDIKNGGTGSDFFPHIKLTTDNKAWDGKNGIDGIRLYIKNPGNAMPLQIIFTTENGTKWILRQDIAGGSDEYVPYDYALGDFHKTNLEGKQRKELTLEELDFSIWDIEINMVSVIPEDTLYFSKMTKLQVAAEDGGKDDNVNNKPTGVAGVGAAVFALAGVTGAALVLCAKKGKKSR